ncbi:MAG: phage antirepressor N-terminal domain-containing protein [Armatimonadia bacterium]
MSKSITVPFHGNTLYVVDNSGQPVVPMKPLVEGMGLAWQPQHKKLTESRFSTCITEMVMQMPGDDQGRAVTCLPLRKLAGWLMTVHPGKIKNLEVRARVIQYQEECDDVLWKYWTDGIAVNRRVMNGLTPAQQRHIQIRVAEMAQAPGNSFARLYGAIKDRFGVGTYKDVPSERYPELCRFLGCEPLEGEWMPRTMTPIEGQVSVSRNNLFVLCQHVATLSEAWRSKLEPGLRHLNSSLAGEMREHVHVAAAMANAISHGVGAAFDEERRQQREFRIRRA